MLCDLNTQEPPAGDASAIILSLCVLLYLTEAK